MKIYSRKRLLQMILLGTGLSIAACGGSGGGGSSSSLQDITPETLETPIRLGSIGVLPASDTSASSYALELSNYSKDKYSVESIKVLGLGNGSTDTLLEADGGLCKELFANGSCTIRLTPHTLKSADVALEVMVKDKAGKISQVYQVIRMSSMLNSSKGGIVMENDVNKIVSEDGNYSLSIPVVLGDTYDDIKANNGSLLCNTEGYLKGASCTYLVKGKTADSGATISTNLQGIKRDKVVTSVGGGTRVEVGRGINILLSSGVTMFHPESSNIVRVYNSGNVTATLVNPVVAGGIATSGGYTGVAAGCASGTLAPNQFCDVAVNVPATTVTNGMGSLAVGYSGGNGASAETGTSSTNLYYTVAKASAGLSIVTNNETRFLQTVVNGATRTVDFTITNTGDRSLANMSIYLAPRPGAELTLAAAPTNGCASLTNHSLAIGASCVVRVSYRPTAATASLQTINLVVNSDYTDSFGQTQSMIQNYAINYSAVLATGTEVVWQPAEEGSSNLVIMNDGVDTRSREWILRNTLAAEENLPATIGAAGITLNPATVNGLSVASVTADTCGSGHVIAGGDSCRYRVTYGPREEVSAAVDVRLNASFALNGTNYIASSAAFSVQTTGSPEARIDVTVNTPTTATTPSLTGNGTESQPYNFTALSNNQLVLEYTYTNSGNAPAYNANFNVGALPMGQVVASDRQCPTGTAIRTLDTGDSCTVRISIPHSKIFDAPNLTSRTTVGPETLGIPFSYSSESSGGRVRQVGIADTPSRRVQFSRLWGTLTHTPVENGESSTAYTIRLTPQIVVGASAVGVTYPIKVSVTTANPIAGVTLPSCEINSGQMQCAEALQVSLPKNMFVESSSLHLSLVARGDGMSENDALQRPVTVQVAAPAPEAVTFNPARLEFVESNPSPTGVRQNLTVTNSNTYPVNLAVTEIPRGLVVDSTGCTAIPARGTCTLHVSSNGTRVNPGDATIRLRLTNLDNDLSSVLDQTFPIKFRPRYGLFLTKKLYQGDMGNGGRKLTRELGRNICENDILAPAVYAREGLNLVPVLDVRTDPTQLDVAVYGALSTTVVGATYHLLTNNDQACLVASDPKRLMSNGVKGFCRIHTLADGTGLPGTEEDDLVPLEYQRGHEIWTGWSPGIDSTFDVGGGVIATTTIPLEHSFNCAGFSQRVAEGGPGNGLYQPATVGIFENDHLRSGQVWGYGTNINRHSDGGWNSSIGGSGIIGTGTEEPTYYKDPFQVTEAVYQQECVWARRVMCVVDAITQ